MVAKYFVGQKQKRGENEWQLMNETAVLFAKKYICHTASGL